MTPVKCSLEARFLSVVIMKVRASWASLTKRRETIAVHSFFWGGGGRCGRWEMKGRKAKTIESKHASSDAGVHSEDGS